ncbi:hypothetical protein [Williamsia sp. DF01-3]|uniref:hypothetical protein n=1 Tax=Williamsia sp. DF01-3 TaxID=2934157 RepID=UPI001FF2D922|nr:hypothetical protein [Williamsia sp. DF01-3]MCK0516983.1 hypothetical protein [Williamsia sp. DF01-3]
MSIRRIQIDLNRRNRAGQTPAPYFGPTPRVGERVVAFEPEDGVALDAAVAEVDIERCRVVLDIDWDSLRDDVAPQAELFVLGMTGSCSQFVVTTPSTPMSRGSGERVALRLSDLLPSSVAIR